MDEQTEELRDLFVETTGAEEVTEDQAEDRGDLADTVPAEEAEARVRELIERMHERYEFRSTLDDDALVRVVTRFFADESDAEIAEALAVDEGTVFDARMDLHLTRETDRDAPFAMDELRELIVADVPLEERVDRLDADAETVDHYSQVIEADLRSTRANGRFADEFAELLTDADLRDSHAADARESGLEEAAEDIETNTQL
ncbi:conditioned medium-induced protein 4 [Halolamina sp. CBA1230]|uniref:conditioned medium-induced protein 4 n=1 Tax=Halolamina sp. CBA1230 TaxID=1853690 RepID=UPI0009A1DEA0|nr:conditioned medium-induced protein 4 [Halolamina sp. CBA1230]QKY20351.1 conditioned medium-induced protein 4 [Halolamina sp. CBA1230]